MQNEASLLPRAPGTYLLVLRASRSAVIQVGKLGRYFFPAGYYVYVGSAFGTGGIRARVGRHLSGGRKLHWHIDYLRSAAVVQEVWFSTEPVSLEHRWAQQIGELEGFQVPVEKFGASDCRCASHLFCCVQKPDFQRAREFAGIPLNRIEAQARG